jgi:hypothetical protein
VRTCASTLPIGSPVSIATSTADSHARLYRNSFARCSGGVMPVCFLRILQVSARFIIF